MSASWDEYAVTEKRALNLLSSLGYTVYDWQEAESVTNSPAAKRSSLHNVLLEPNLRTALERINPWLNANNLTKAVNAIKPARIKAGSLIEANEKIYRKLVSYISLVQDLGDGKKNQTVKYIDFEHPAKNEFLVLNQYRVKGHETIIPDIVIFINGIPVAVIECKNPTACDEPEAEAIKQLQRYQNTRNFSKPEGAEQLFYTNQILVAAWRESASASTIAAPARSFKAWKDPHPVQKEVLEELIGENELTLQDILLYALFQKERLLDLIRNFIVFEHKGNSLVKMLARYQQYRAVNKALARIKQAKTLKARSGIIWHTQGSGKSLTMLFLALKLRRRKDKHTPTLLIVTDRVDLDEQISGTFQRCGFPNPVQAKSVKHLKNLLKSAANRTIMTTIHKFQEYDKAKYPVLSTDSNIFVMADEAHRTQFKDLANNMRTALPYACYLGFTGTPIDKETKSTIRTFGDYIDTYTIDESVEDGATLPIKYEGRLPQLKVEGRDLDKIFDRVFKDYSDAEKKLIKEKYATEKDIAEAKSRIEHICLDIIEHYESKIAPLKAQIVTVSRKAAARYKESLDNLHAPESAVLISSDKNDEAIIKKYSTTKEQRKQIVERFKKPNSSLRFIIVCDMLLTGFDAPPEQVMYLDKSLKEHNLLQAIARVNRVFEEKNYGLVVDYYGVFDYLRQALAIFNSQDIKNVVTPIRDEKPRLEANYRAVMKFFDRVNTNSLEACIAAFAEKEKRERFKQAFKEFAKSMDIVMPDPIATPYREDLKFLGKVYRAVRNRYRDDNLDVKGVGNKVKRLIDEHIRTLGIKRLNEPVSILDKEKFDKVLEEVTTKKGKASEMEHAIRKEIEVRIKDNPIYYQSLKEKLEEIIKEREEGRTNFTEQLHKLRGIIENIRNVRSKAARLGFDEKEFALYELLLAERELSKQDSRVAENKKNNYTDLNKNDYIDERVKQLTLEIIGKVKHATEIDMWFRKNTVLKRMRKDIKVCLYKYEEFRNKIDSLTTNIMKLIRNIFMVS